MREPVSSWREEAACKGLPPAMFILDRGTPAGPAKAVCGECTVQQHCDDYASSNNVIGVWGGEVHTYNRAKDVTPVAITQDARPMSVENELSPRTA